MLTGTSNSSSNKTISLVLVMAELTGAGCFAVPWPGSSLRGVRQHRHGPGRTPHLGEGRGTPRTAQGWRLGSAALSSLVLLLCSDLVGLSCSPHCCQVLPGGAWPRCPTRCLPWGLAGGFGDVKPNWDLLASHYVFWFECKHRVVHACCWKRGMTKRMGY